MAFITKPNKKKQYWKDPDKVSARQRVYQSKRWQRLRLYYLSEHPLCEECLAQGKIQEAIDVHHMTTFVGAVNAEELAYNYDNLKALCKQCHQKIHNRKHKNPLYNYECK